MIDESQLRKEMNIGVRVAEILEDETIVAVFAKMEADAIQHWRDCEDASKASDSRAWDRLHALDSFRQELQSFVTTGKMAAQQLAEVRRGKGGEGE